MLRAGTVLRAESAKTGVAPAARSNCSGNDALSLGVSDYRRPELLDHSDWLVADRETLRDRILTLHDVDVGAADRGRGDAHEGIERTDIRDFLFIERNAAGLHENRHLHLFDHL